MSTLLKHRGCIRLFIQILNKPNPATRTVVTNFRKLPKASILTSYNPNLDIYRTKSKASKKKQKAEESDGEESEAEHDDFENLIIDKNTKVLTIKVNSMRADVVLKTALSIARNKVEELFYESKIRVNGKKIAKKSDAVHVGDEVDIIKGVNINTPQFLTVARVEILEIFPKGDAVGVRVRRCKSLTIDNYEERWQPGE